MKHEFDKLVGMTTDTECYKRIEYVYMNCEQFNSKQELADYYKKHDMNGIEKLYKEVLDNEGMLNVMKSTNNSSYNIYITSSADAAHLISRGLREATPWTKQGGKTISISSGCVHQDCRIPSIYHGSDKFYALIEYRNGEAWNHPEYQLAIC